MSYPKRENDAERVDFLRSLAVLDTAPDENLDRIVELCRQIFGVSISNVSLVDGERQWFKAIVGLDVCETDRDVAFCNYTIMGDEIFEVCDATADPNFSSNPLVTGDPYIRYYAGAPLVYEGVHLGALCLIDSEARPPLTEQQRIILRSLADIVVHEMRMNRMVKEAIALLTDVG